MNRKPENILHSIKYWIKINQWYVSKPITDYTNDRAVHDLIVEKLESLQKEYRIVTKQPFFNWYDLQSPARTED